ncbi:unnamed protein product [Vicia faba]|uniref:Basic leucine-zipper C-terminal domain-containing protein n=1 Tax=Vicia faba TaxID=3906 RepID=A0AAV0YUZ1_VICFA|nr:unnamed protein product [Vicia faba]
MMALHMQMLDQHLHCPTFGTHRILNQTTPTISNLNEAIAHLRLSPLSYLSVLREPLQGEDITTSIQKGSLDWERVVRCIRHALHTTPSPDWWRRVLVLAPCHRPSFQGSTAGAVFSSEMICEAVIDRIVELSKLTNSEINCWQDWLVFSDIFYFSYENMPDMSSMGMPSFDGSTSDNSADAAVPVQDDPHHRFYQHT